MIKASIENKMSAIFECILYSKAVNRNAVFRPETPPQRVKGMSN